MSDKSNSNSITRDYLDSLLIETRYVDSDRPDPTFTLYGETFRTPIMTAALSHLDHFMFEGAHDAYVRGAAEAGAVLWIGMEEDDAKIEACAKAGTKVIEIIKPYADRSRITEKIRRAERLGHLAVGVDIDHPFAENGDYDEVDGIPMRPMTTDDLADMVTSTSLPVIVKGVLSIHDARRALAAGCRGIVLSHHNNRIGYAVPPLMALPAIRDFIKGRMPIFVDDEIATGMDAYKALALGATAVCIGRPLMTAIKDNGAEGVTAYLNRATDELKKAMAYTGVKNLSEMDPSVIYRREF